MFKLRLVLRAAGEAGPAPSAEAGRGAGCPGLRSTHTWCGIIVCGEGLRRGLRLVSAPAPADPNARADPIAAVGARTSPRARSPRTRRPGPGNPGSLFAAAFRLALIQLQVSSIKSENLARACGLVREAARQGAKVVSLPVSVEAAAGGPGHPFWKVVLVMGRPEVIGCSGCCGGHSSEEESPCLGHSPPRPASPSPCRPASRDWL